MKFSPIFSQKLLIIILLFILLAWSVLIQNYFLTSFDRAKQAVSRWPYFSTPHFIFAQELFNSGSPESKKEFLIGKQALFVDKNLLGRTEEEVTQPERIADQINYWQSFVSKGIESPEVYLKLALLNFRLYKNEEAKKYWEKAFYLDPNNPMVDEVKRIITN